MQKKHTALAASARVYHLKCQHEWRGRTVASFWALLKLQLHIKFKFMGHFIRKMVHAKKKKVKVTFRKSFFPSFYFLEKGAQI